MYNRTTSVTSVPSETSVTSHMSNRPSMLGSEIRTIIAPALKECMLTCGVVSITKVDVSKDLAYATVYLSALQKPQDAVAFFESRKHELQQLLGKSGLARVPTLRFRIDEGLEATNRIDHLLR